MDRERGKGGGEHERSGQEKEARVGWVIRQIHFWCCYLRSLS